MVRVKTRSEDNVRRRALWAAGVALLALASGCVSQGLVEGRLARPGEPATPVTFTWRSEPFDSAGTMSVTLPDGEMFSGRYLQITTAATTDTLGGWGWGAWGPGPWGVGAWGPGPWGVGPWGPGPWGPGPWGVGPWGVGPWYGPDWTTFARNYSGRVEATLFGDRGHTMRCHFHLASPTAGMSEGGVGSCEVSTGEHIEAQF